MKQPLRADMTQLISFRPSLAIRTYACVNKSNPPVRSFFLWAGVLN